ncbi:Patched domain-containing protein 3 [Desmophyllum pertusum]|uniref:Patched domain-containing protein 3 n=1 Tax=Desmophyllum pertusum TaxID=174260 RepID=A0A9W9ZPU1_9CNID|nr:Patched domain-containing protein 3 [Desmophyllum pertusum]
MFIWNVSLNSVSMINLVMAIGFAVDYSAHIAHAYVLSNKLTANERVVDALSTLGASVFMGGFSTFLGMIVLAFASLRRSSEYFPNVPRHCRVWSSSRTLYYACLSVFAVCWRPAVVRSPSIRGSAERLAVCCWSLPISARTEWRNNEDLACTSEKSDTRTNDETPALDDTPAANNPEEFIPAANGNEESIPAANKNESTAHASNGTDANNDEDSSANKSEEPVSTHNATGKRSVGAFSYRNNHRYNLGAQFSKSTVR